MKILGVSSFYHDSAVALLENGKVTVALEEERFTRVKHDNSFPSKALAFCLHERKLKGSDIDALVYYEKPLLRFERVLENIVKSYPFTLKPFLDGIPEWINHKIKVEKSLRKELNYKGKIYYVPHHLSHASAAYYPSQFKEAAIVTLDGIGEYQTTGLWHGQDNIITPLLSLNFPHSLGLLYSAFTAFLGFRVNEDEYKVMGLSAYGKPTYKDHILQTLDLKDDGSFRLDMSYYSFGETSLLWKKKFEQIFGQPRFPDDPITSRHKNIASSIQYVLELIYFSLLNHLYTLTKSKNLCIGGGVALNALANGKIYERTPFEQVYVFGPAGDAGSAAGAGWLVYHQVLGHKKRHILQDLRLGTATENDEIRKILDEKFPFLKFERLSEKELIIRTAKILTANNIIGWFQGRMEYGPRALGARSILASPLKKSMMEKVNKVKYRELFRPFAGSILQEHVHDYFDVPEKKYSSPFMVFCFPVKTEKRQSLQAIVHKDGTCRIQTVSKEYGRYYQLIKEFYRQTGVPCILNTSFNVKGEPIVENPEQALQDMLHSSLDYVVIEDYLIWKDREVSGISLTPEGENQR